MVQEPPGSSLFCSMQSFQSWNLVFSISTFQGLETPADLGARQTINADERLSEGRLVPAWLSSSCCCFVKRFCEGTAHCLSPS